MRSAVKQALQEKASTLPRGPPQSTPSQAECFMSTMPEIMPPSLGTPGHLCCDTCVPLLWPSMTPMCTLARGMCMCTHVIPSVSNPGERGRPFRAVTTSCYFLTPTTSEQSALAEHKCKTLTDVTRVMEMVFLKCLALVAIGPKGPSLRSTSLPSAS